MKRFELISDWSKISGHVSIYNADKISLENFQKLLKAKTVKQLYVAEAFFIKRVASALKIHISEESVKILKTFGTFIMSERGVVEMKGKGKKRTYWLHGEYNKIVVPVDEYKNVIGLNSGGLGGMHPAFNYTCNRIDGDDSDDLSLTNSVIPSTMPITATSRRYLNQTHSVNNAVHEASEVDEAATPTNPPRQLRFKECNTARDAEKGFFEPSSV